MNIDNLLLLITGAIFYSFFIFISIKFPIIPAAIYPLTFISSTQFMFSVGGVSPSKYIGVVLIFVGMLTFLKEIKSSSKRNYSLLGLFFIFMLFPIWILIRFLIEGSAIDVALTFMLNALTIFSIVVIVTDKKRKSIMEISLGVTFVAVSIGMIVAYFFPSIAIFRFIQEADYLRTSGLINDPNYGGAFIAIGITFFFSKLVYAYETGRKRQFYLVLFLVAISIIGLGMTLSRAAILSGVVCILIILFGKVKFKNMFWLSLLTIFFYGLNRLFPVIIEGIVYRFSISTVDNSNINRLATFQRGIHVFENNILVGIGQFSGFHNTFINVAVIGGIIGFLSFVLIIAMVFIMNIKIMTSIEQEFRETARFVVFGLIVYLFNSLFVGIERDRIAWFLFGWGIINFILYDSTARTRTLTTQA